METQTRADPELDSTELLLDLAAALHGAYLPADELERRIREVARGLHVDGEIFTSQTLAAVDLQGSPGARLRRIAFSPHWNLSRLHALVDLCDGIAAGRIGLAAARPELDRIASAPRRYRHALVVAASAVYAAAVAARVGGGGSEMLAAGFIGIVAGVIQFGGLRFPSLDLQKSFLATFAGTLAAVTLGQSLLPFNAERAIFGAMTLLGAHEVATEESVEAGFVRLAYGLLRFLMLALGTVAAAKLWLLFGGLPAPVPAHGLPTAAVVAILVPGGLALVVVVQGRARDAGWMVAAVLVAWGAEKLTKEAFGSDGSPFLATFALGVFAYVQARLPGHLPATVIFPGLMQIAPGFLGAETVVALLRPSAADAGKTFLHVLLVALQIVTGLMAASLAQGSVARRATAT